MEGLIGVIAMAVVVVLAVTLLARSPGARRSSDLTPGDRAPAGRPPGRRPDDQDGVDEADHVTAAIGGAIRPGDAVTVHIDDPAAWGATSFDLDLSIAAVSRAEIRDSSGLFSFMAYWMTTGPDADVLMVEGDVPALSEGFIGKLLRDPALVEGVTWCRDHYLSAAEEPEVDVDLSEHGLGTWTAFSLREGGTLRVEAGTATLLPAAAAAGGLPYRDFTLRPAASPLPERLRLVQIGGYSYLFRGEVVSLQGLRFLRRTPTAP